MHVYYNFSAIYEVIVVKPICFSKVEFVELVGYGCERRIMLLDLAQAELSYQVLRRKKSKMSVIEGVETVGTGKYTFTYQFGRPACVAKSGKNDFRGQLIAIEDDACELIFSCGIKLNAVQLQYRCRN